jgi:hypothetical protein
MKNLNNELKNMEMELNYDPNANYEDEYDFTESTVEEDVPFVLVTAKNENEIINLEKTLLAPIAKRTNVEFYEVYETEVKVYYGMIMNDIVAVSALIMSLESRAKDSETTIECNNMPKVNKADKIRVQCPAENLKRYFKEIQNNNIAPEKIFTCYYPKATGQLDTEVIIVALTEDERTILIKQFKALVRAKKVINKTNKVKQSVKNTMSVSSEVLNVTAEASAELTAMAVKTIGKVGFNASTAFLAELTSDFDEINIHALKEHKNVKKIANNINALLNKQPVNHNNDEGDFIF